MNLETPTLSALSLLSPQRAGGINTAAMVVDLTEQGASRMDRCSSAMVGVVLCPEDSGVGMTVSPSSEHETVPHTGTEGGGPSTPVLSPRTGTETPPPPKKSPSSFLREHHRNAKQLRRLQESQGRRLEEAQRRKRERPAGGATASPTLTPASSSASAAKMNDVGSTVSGHAKTSATLDDVKRQLMRIERKAREYAVRELEFLNRAKQLRDAREVWTRKYHKYARRVAAKDPTFAPASLPPILRR